MAKVNGTTIGCWVKRSTDPEYIFIGYATGDDVSVNVDLPEATTKGSGGWRESIQGVRSVDGSVTGLHDPESTFGKDELFDLVDNRESIMIQYGDPDLTGSKYLEFEANLESYTLNSEMESPAGLDFSFQSTGQVQNKTVTS